MARTSKSRGAKPFSMRSSNKTTFKMMGSTSPMRTEPTTTDATTTDSTTTDYRIGMHPRDIKQAYKPHHGNTGTTSGARSRDEEIANFEKKMQELTDQGIGPGRAYGQLFGGEWKLGYTDPKTGALHENTFSNQDGFTVDDILGQGHNPNLAGTVTDGVTGLITGTLEVDSATGKPININKQLFELGQKTTAANIKKKNTLPQHRKK